MTVNIFAIMFPIWVAIGFAIYFYLENKKQKQAEAEKIKRQEDMRPRRIFDYTNNRWGHACSMESTNDTWPFMYSGHFFYDRPRNIILSGCYDIKIMPRPHVGDFLAVKGQKNPVIFVKITQLKWTRDPGDMYFFKGVSPQTKEEITEFADMNDAVTYEFIKLIDRLDNEQKQTVDN